jgi:hypothetical protein
MCFSAAASLTASVLLLSVGARCIKTALKYNKNYLPIAGLPTAFGIQQACEGGLWIGLTSHHTHLAAITAFGFLFFSHFFWLFWIPFSAFKVEPIRILKSAFLVFSVIGLLFGLFLYVPLLIRPGWLEFAITHGSIDYRIRVLSDPLISRDAGYILYAAIILIPLLLSHDRPTRCLGISIALSMFVTFLFLHYAFVSIWCFFAALLSIQVFYSLPRIDNRRAETPL